MSGFKPVTHRYDDALSRVSWDAFERLMAEHYRRLGYAVEHVGTGGGFNRTDGGIDLLLRREQEVIVVQCKHWNCWQVPHNDVHQLIGVMHTAGAIGAIIITSGEFTPKAIESGFKFRHIRLIDGRAVRAMLGPVAEPEMPHATVDCMPDWAPVRPRRSARRRSHSPLVAAAAALITMAVTLTVLYQYYLNEIQRAQLEATRASMTQAATRLAQASRMPPTYPGFTAHKPTSTIQGHPAIVHDTPTSKTDIAEWERQNAASMRILEKTTPSLP
ncbi:restriction endonuclease [Luteibacter flocculans]|uniref:Restriction endonuclease n=1 Tax=Luteibacter flocculans TaxID=2780091 RepID=A0ABY4T548_9GAMM|nr:restriction endonuclease [Luteibacter flocculans]URL59017.1 restriction endonuclease [Luteibacter flocculans]